MGPGPGPGPGPAGHGAERPGQDQSGQGQGQSGPGAKARARASRAARARAGAGSHRIPPEPIEASASCVPAGALRARACRSAWRSVVGDPLSRARHSRPKQVSPLPPAPLVITGWPPGPGNRVSVGSWGRGRPGAHTLTVERGDACPQRRTMRPRSGPGAAGRPHVWCRRRGPACGRAASRMARRRSSDSRAPPLGPVHEEGRPSRALEFCACRSR